MKQTIYCTKTGKPQYTIDLTELSLLNEFQLDDAIIATQAKCINPLFINTSPKQLQLLALHKPIEVTSYYFGLLLRHAIKTNNHVLKHSDYLSQDFLYIYTIDYLAPIYSYLSEQPLEQIYKLLNLLINQIDYYNQFTTKQLESINININQFTTTLNKLSIDNLITKLIDSQINIQEMIAIKSINEQQRQAQQLRIKRINAKAFDEFLKSEQPITNSIKKQTPLTTEQRQLLQYVDDLLEDNNNDSLVATTTTTTTTTTTIQSPSKPKTLSAFRQRLQQAIN